MAVPDDPVLIQHANINDEIHRPRHYTYSPIEPIQVIEHWRLGFHLGCVVKYLCRAAHKGDQLLDLHKARWYLSREIDRLEDEQARLIEIES